MRDVLPSGLAKVRCLKEGPVDAVLQLERMKHVGKEGGRAAKKGLRNMHLIKKQTTQKHGPGLFSGGPL